MNLFKTYKTINMPFVISNMYSIYKRFLFSHTVIRTHLLKIKTPPQEGDSFAVQTIKHLQLAFPFADSPINAFQNHFRVSFLSF
jgi:hypothetical protein